MNHPLFFALLATLLTGLGFLCLDLTKRTKGKGSWKADNELKILAGALWGWAIIAASLAILSMIGGGA